MESERRHGHNNARIWIDCCCRDSGGSGHVSVARVLSRRCPIQLDDWRVSVYERNGWVFEPDSASDHGWCCSGNGSCDTGCGHRVFQSDIDVLHAYLKGGRGDRSWAVLFEEYGRSETVLRWSNRDLAAANNGGVLPGSREFTHHDHVFGEACKAGHECS